MTRKTYDQLKTVAEQTAYDFGARFAGMSEALKRRIASSYSYTHGYALFPRSDDGYQRLMAAFLSGAEYRGEI